MRGTCLAATPRNRAVSRYSSQPAHTPVAAASRASAATTTVSAQPSVGASRRNAALAAPRKTKPTMFAKRGGRESSIRALAEARLDHLEVEEAGQAEAPSQRRARRGRCRQQRRASHSRSRDEGERARALPMTAWFARGAAGVDDVGVVIGVRATVDRHAH